MTHPDVASTSLGPAHPLIRLALGDQILHHRFRRVQTELRKLIDPVRRAALTASEQHEVVESVRCELPRLGLSPEDSLLFQRDLLKLLMQLLPRPALLQDLFNLELEHCNLTLWPSFWCTGGLVLTDPTFPQLIDPQRTNVPTRGILLPSICSEAAAAARRLTGTALADGSISSWPIQDCEIVLRLLVMDSLLGTTGDAIASNRQARYESFETEGMKLWSTLAERVNWQAEPDAAPFLWEHDLRTRVLLELRPGRETSNVAPAKARSGAHDFSRAGDDKLAGKERTVREQKEPKDGASAETAGFLRVITTPIPAATHKEDQDTLAQYKVLREPLAVTVMPTPERVRALLREQEAEFPWAEGPLRLLRERLVTASMLGVQQLHLPPVLLVGSPGCGKSRFVRRLAQRLGVPYMPLSLAGAHDPKLLSGTSRGWSTGDASPLVRLMLQHRSACAFVLLDELDKVGRNGESTSPIANQLLGLLEPETASRWRDGFLQANCDLSRVIFWGTANSLDGISKPLLSRMELVVMRGPSRENLPGIAAGIVADLEQEWQLPAGTLPPVPETVWSLGADNLRTMRRALLEYLHQWVQQERQPERMH